MSPMCIFRPWEKPGKRHGTETFGILYYAEIFRFGEKARSEIEEVRLFPELPSGMDLPTDSARTY